MVDSNFKPIGKHAVIPVHDGPLTDQFTTVPISRQPFAPSEEERHPEGHPGTLSSVKIENEPVLPISEVEQVVALVNDETVIEPAVEPVIEPIGETIVEPTIGPVVEPVAKPAIEPMALPQSTGAFTPERAILHRKNGNDIITVTGNSFKIGRRSEYVDYAICDNKLISGVHAKLEKVDGKWFIQDLNSTNSTRINEVKLIPLTKNELNSGDIIRLSNEEFEFILDGGV